MTRYGEDGCAPMPEDFSAGLARTREAVQRLMLSPVIDMLGLPGRPPSGKPGNHCFKESSWSI